MAVGSKRRSCGNCAGGGFRIEAWAGQIEIGNGKASLVDRTVEGQPEIFWMTRGDWKQALRSGEIEAWLAAMVLFFHFPYRAFLLTPSFPSPSEGGSGRAARWGGVDEL